MYLVAWSISEIVSSMAVNGVGGRLFRINRVMERRVSNQPQPRLSIIHRGGEYEYIDAAIVSDLSNIQSIIISFFKVKKESLSCKKENQMKSL